MDKILISACLLGDKTKYDGGDNYWPFVEKLKEKYDLIPFCPEVSGGLPVPRVPSEIQPNGSVLSKTGKDVSASFALGAKKAYEAARLFGVVAAILKDGSPSCGSRYVYDGTFSGTRVAGLGVTARRLIASGIKVYSSEDELSFLLEGKKEENPRKKGTKTKSKPFGKTYKAADRPKSGQKRPYKGKGKSFHKGTYKKGTR